MSAASRQAPAPMDTKTALKILLSVLVGVGAVGTLFYFSMKEDMELYRHVDEVAAKSDDYIGKRVQVHGFVKHEVTGVKGTLKHRWDLESRAPRGPGLVRVRYTGLIPDTLKKDAEVVATGTLGREGQELILTADHVTAQCPSKYDESKPKLQGEKNGQYPSSGYKPSSTAAPQPANTTTTTATVQPVAPAGL